MFREKRSSPCKNFFKGLGNRIIWIILWPIVTAVSFPKMIRIYRDPNIPVVALCTLDPSRNQGTNEEIHRQDCCLRDCCRSTSTHTSRAIDKSHYVLERRYGMSASFFRHQQATHYIVGGTFVCVMLLSALIFGIVSLDSDNIDPIRCWSAVFQYGNYITLSLPFVYGCLIEREMFIESLLHCSNTIRCCLRRKSLCESAAIREARIALITNPQGLLELESTLESTPRFQLNRSFKNRINDTIQELNRSSFVSPDPLKDIVISYLYNKDLIEQHKLYKTQSIKAVSAHPEKNPTATQMRLL